MALVIDNLVSEGLVDFRSRRSQMGSTAVSASTLTMTVNSEYIQRFTGSTTGQIVKLPDATTLTVGYQYYLINDSSVNVTVQDSAASTLMLLGAGQRTHITCSGTGSAAGTWSYEVAVNVLGGTQFYFTYPGSGLVVNYTGGNYRLNGTLTAIAGGSITLPGSTTGTIYVDVDGVIKATASIPANATPLYNFVTSAGAVTTLTDVREELETNIIWGAVGDMVTVTAGQAKSAGTSEKYARADHVHGNGNLLVKAGTVAAGSFTGSPKKYTVTFGTAFASTSYAISLESTDNRSLTFESKTAGGFVINTNANAALTGNVDWQAIFVGEAT